MIRIAPPSPVTDPWLTLREAAGETKISTETLRRAIRSGRLRAIRPSGGRSGPYLVRRSSVDAWLEHAAVETDVDIFVARGRR